MTRPVGLSREAIRTLRITSQEVRRNISRQQRRFFLRRDSGGGGSTSGLLTYVSSYGQSGTQSEWLDEGSGSYRLFLGQVDSSQDWVWDDQAMTLTPSQEGAWLVQFNGVLNGPSPAVDGFQEVGINLQAAGSQTRTYFLGHSSSDRANIGLPFSMNLVWLYKLGDIFNTLSFGVRGSGATAATTATGHSGLTVAVTRIALTNDYTWDDASIRPPLPPVVPP